MVIFSNWKIFIPKLYLNNIEIERVTVFKNLGFLVDSKLNHKFHVKHLEASLSIYRYISSKIRLVLTIDSAKTFYYGMVHSIVCYGLLVWGAVLIEGVSAKRLCKLQNKIIYNLFANDNESILDIKSICKRMDILQLPDLYKVNACTCIFKIINENYAPFLVDSIEQYSREHDNNI